VGGRLKKVTIMAGGTGGHIFPALAVADELKKQNIKVKWIGSQFGLEKKIVTGRYPISYLPIVGVRKRSLLTKLLLPFYFAAAFFKALYILWREKPDVVLAMGGYAAAPGGVAAWCLHIPLVVQDQNARLGLTNKLLSRFAKKRLQAFPNTFPEKLNPQTVGNPVRETLTQMILPETRFANRNGSLNILILGGSQGAQPLNEIVTKAVQQIREPANYSIWWQAGEKKLHTLKPQTAHLGDNIKVVGFIDDIAKAYEWADLVVCRSGAMTVCELAAVGLPAIFVPYPYAVDDHQYYNARYLEQVGAAKIIRQRDLTPEMLLDLWRELRQDRDRLLSMAVCAKKEARLDSTHLIITALEACSKT